MENNIIEEIKILCLKWVDKVLENKLTYTKPGSLLYLLYGERPSEQSLTIKFGKLGEYMCKELVKKNNNLDLLKCGIQKINNNNKDVDLIFKDNKKKIIYYFELKANIELDTEKVCATVDKCNEINVYLREQYNDYEIEFGILNWSIYNRDNLTRGLSHIKTFEKENIKVNHIQDFLKIISLEWEEKDYYLFFREIGNKVNKKYK